MKLRHVPLLLCRELARHKYRDRIKLSNTISEVIQRADELAEFLSIYWKDGRQSLSKQVKLGLAKAFQKFSAYDLAKYNRNEVVKLRDVLFLCHAKPKDKEQAKIWKQLIDKKLPVPDTWEVSLSAGKDKKATFKRLIKENKLGALALLRNLRNMKEAEVDEDVIIKALNTMKVERVLPFRFVSAANYAPHLEEYLEEAMFKCLESQEKLPGKTILVVDVSGSMSSAGNISENSSVTRLDAACSLAILVREMCEKSSIYATAGSDSSRIHKTSRVASRRGFALRDSILKEMYTTLGGGGIFLKQCLNFIYEEEKTADRIIVITDEQDCDIHGSPSSANAFGKNNYIINISVDKHGIAYDKFIHINSFSESVLEYIKSYESISKFEN